MDKENRWQKVKYEDIDVEREGGSANKGE